MLNEIALVGQIADIKETDNGKVSNITIAVPRKFKNSDGIYETDFFPISMKNEMVKNVAEYCTKGDIIGVKGTLSSKDNTINIVAEKVSFLTAAKTKNDKNVKIDKKI